MSVRINRYLAQAGVCSRREADRLIAAGKVTVDGRIALPGEQVSPGQEIRVGKKLLHPEEEKILLAFYKPRGVVCTTEKKWGDPTVEELLHYPKRVFYVGRLDKESEGLLLLTNDGDLQEAIARAANGHEKEYIVKIDRPVSDAFLERMSGGIFLKELDVKTRPCQVKRLGKQTFSIVLTQGLNRQIRRMCRVCGCSVVSLKRVRVMNILLGNLQPGKYRPVTKAERQELYELLGWETD